MLYDENEALFHFSVSTLLLPQGSADRPSSLYLNYTCISFESDCRVPFTPSFAAQLISFSPRRRSLCRLSLIARPRSDSLVTQQAIHEERQRRLVSIPSSASSVSLASTTSLSPLDPPMLWKGARESVPSSCRNLLKSRGSESFSAPSSPTRARHPKIRLNHSLSGDFEEHADTLARLSLASATQRLSPSLTLPMRLPPGKVLSRLRPLRVEERAFLQSEDARCLDLQPVDRVVDISSVECDEDESSHSLFPSSHSPSLSLPSSCVPLSLSQHVSSLSQHVSSLSQHTLSPSQHTPQLSQHTPQLSQYPSQLSQRTPSLSQYTPSHHSLLNSEVVFLQPPPNTWELSTTPIDGVAFAYVKITREWKRRFLVLSRPSLRILGDPVEAALRLECPWECVQRAVLSRYDGARSGALVQLDRRDDTPLFFSFQTFALSQSFVRYVRRRIDAAPPPRRPSASSSPADLLRWALYLYQPERLPEADTLATTVHVPTYLRETWNVAPEMLYDSTHLLKEGLVVTEKEVVSVNDYLLETRESQEVISESVVAAARDLRSLMGGVLFQRFVQISTIHYPSPFPLLRTVLSRMNPEWTALFDANPLAFIEGLQRVELLKRNSLSFRFHFFPPCCDNV